MRNTCVLDDVDHISSYFYGSKNNLDMKFDSPEALFRHYFPDYKNDRPLDVPKEMLKHMTVFGYPRDTRSKFKKIMKSCDPIIRKKGLRLFIRE